jgi:hypothetical protein
MAEFDGEDAGEFMPPNRSDSFMACCGAKILTFSPDEPKGGACFRGGAGDLGGPSWLQRRRVLLEHRRSTASRRLVTAVVLFLGGCVLQGASALGPPPHLRACPGPLDQGSGSICATSGNASMAEAVAEGTISTGKVVLKVNRLGGFGGEGGIAYVLVNGTARAGIDFLGTRGVIRWAAGQAQPRSISIPLIDTGEYTKGFGRCVSTLTARLETLEVSEGSLGISGVSETEVTIVNTNAKRGFLHLPMIAMTVSELQVLKRLMKPNVVLRPARMPQRQSWI